MPLRRAESFELKVAFGFFGSAVSPDIRLVYVGQCRSGILHGMVGSKRGLSMLDHHQTETGSEQTTTFGSTGEADCREDVPRRRNKQTGLAWSACVPRVFFEKLPTKNQKNTAYRVAMKPN